MRKAGGIVGLIAGIFGFIAAIVTLFLGGLGGAFDARGADTIIGLGWGGIFFSFMVIIFGSIQIGAKGKIPSILLTLSSLAGIFLGGKFVAVCLSLSFIGGILGLVERNKNSVLLSQEIPTQEASLTITKEESKKNIKDFIVERKIAISLASAIALLLLIFILPQSREDRGFSRVEHYSRETSEQDLSDLQPSQQKDFIKIIQKAQVDLDKATNDMIVGGIRQKRREEICRLVGWGSIDDWVGIIKTLDSNTEGKGILVLQIADNVTLGTWNNSLSDFKDGTLLNPTSDLFSQVSKMNIGEAVVFSGLFILDDKDCVGVQNITANASISKPKFIFKFSAVSLLDQDAASRKEIVQHPQDTAHSESFVHKGKKIYSGITSYSNVGIPTNHAQAQETARSSDDGPDFFSVKNVTQDDVLNIRSEPDSKSTSIGEIPYNGVGLRNLGCNDDLFSQRLEMEPEERMNSTNNRWCKVEYRGVLGWVNGKFLKEDDGRYVGNVTPDIQNEVSVEIMHFPDREGFLVKATTALSAIHSRNSVPLIKMKKGDGVIITGISSDEMWFEIERGYYTQGKQSIERGYNNKEKFYVPTGDVRFFRD